MKRVWGYGVAIGDPDDKFTWRWQPACLVDVTPFKLYEEVILEGHLAVRLCGWLQFMDTKANRPLYQALVHLQREENTAWPNHFLICIVVPLDRGRLNIRLPLSIDFIRRWGVVKVEWQSWKRESWVEDLSEGEDEYGPIDLE